MEVDTDYADVVGRIANLGWRQGSVLAPDHARRLDTQVPNRMRFDPDRDYLVVASHDCDVLQQRLDREPFVELVVARPVDGLDGNFQHGKNGRLLHAMTAGANKISMQAFDRFFVDRSLLSIEAPFDSISDGDGARHLSTMRRWLANRYSRSGFPDEFNKRLANPTQRKRRQAAVEAFRNPAVGGATTAIFISLNTTSELTSQHPYELDVVASMPSRYFNDRESLKGVSGALATFVSYLSSCEGIEVKEFTVVPDSQFSIEDVYSSLRFDFDYLSLRDADDAPIAPM